MRNIKVKELIESLQKFNPESKVTLAAEGMIREIDSVEDYGKIVGVVIGNED